MACRPVKKKFIWTAAMAVCVMGIVLPLLYLVGRAGGTITQQRLDQAVHGLYVPPEIHNLHTPVSESEIMHNDSFIYGAGASNAERLQPLIDMNADFVAMLTIPGLGLALPVVQGQDNTQYLNTSFTGGRSRHGAIFLDAANNRGFTDPNNVLYGHRMNDGTMFAGLALYKSISGYQNAPFIIVDSVNGATVWLVFSVYVCKADDNYFQTQFTENAFEVFIGDISSRSMYSTGVDANANDLILTLSTCDYSFDNARLAVHARLLRDGETIIEPNARRN
jgi:sortase B